MTSDNVATPGPTGVATPDTQQVMGLITGLGSVGDARYQAQQDAQAVAEGTAYADIIADINAGRLTHAEVAPYFEGLAALSDAVRNNRPKPTPVTNANTDNSSSSRSNTALRTYAGIGQAMTDAERALNMDVTGDPARPVERFNMILEAAQRKRPVSTPQVDVAAKQDEARRDLLDEIGNEIGEQRVTSMSVSTFKGKVVSAIRALKNRGETLTEERDNARSNLIAASDAVAYATGSERRRNESPAAHINRVLLPQTPQAYSQVPPQQAQQPAPAAQSAPQQGSGSGAQIPTWGQRRQTAQQQGQHQQGQAPNPSTAQQPPVQGQSPRPGAPQGGLIGNLAARKRGPNQ